MKRVLTVLFAVLCFAAIGSSFAALKFTTGEKLQHNLSICLKKEDALAIIAADVKGGFEAASKVWEAKPECGNFDIVGPTVGLIVHSAKVTRNDKTVTVNLVEILNAAGEPVAYFMTTGTVEAKRDRNT